MHARICKANISLTSTVLALSALAISAGQAIAEPGYPSRNITLVVAFPPGGPPDVVARIIGPRVGEALGRPIIVENRPGASATIAANSVARAEPDGHTLLAADLSLVVSPFVVSKITYDPQTDFRFVVQTARTGITMVIDPKLPIKTVADLVETAKRDPTAIKAAHTGIGTPPHLGLLSFLQATGLQVLQVPYKGAALAIQDIVAGHISLLCTGPSTSISLTKEGRVRMLGVTGSRRLTALPDVPTFDESGVDMGGMKGGQYFGIAAPAKTPDSVVAKINAAVNSALKDPEVREKLAKVAFEPVGGSAEAFADFIRSQSSFWKGAFADMASKPK